MKKFAIPVVILVIAAGGWYLASPLLINDVVDEDFPASEEVVVKMDEHELTQSEIDAMSEEEKMEMEREIIEKMADEPDEVMEEEKPVEPTALATGSFEGADSFHQGSGTATLYGFEADSNILRFEDFTVTNGPDLRVFLTKEANPTKEQVKAGLEIAKLKGNKGNQNYVLPAEVDPTAYKAAVIYCKPFSVVFATANLN